MNKILEAILKGLLMGLEIQDDELDLTAFQKHRVASRSYKDILTEALIKDLVSYPKCILSNVQLKEIVQYCDRHETKVTASNETLPNIIDLAIGCFGTECDLNWIDVSKCTTMSKLFNSGKRKNFNGDISRWDVSNVKYMAETFADSKFNGDISNWDVSNVSYTSSMFTYSSFNGDISRWDVSNVINMSSMFESSIFNGDISNWNVSKVFNMANMFSRAEFNGDISRWDVSNVVYMPGMFRASNFNQDISNWKLDNVINTTYMFADTNFDQDLSKWKAPSIKYATSMFDDCPIQLKHMPKFYRNK